MKSANLLLCTMTFSIVLGASIAASAEQATAASMVTPDALSLSQFKWKKRVLVVSAPTGTDADMADQRAQLAATDQEFADRDMLLVTLLDDTVSTAGNGELTPEETVKVRASLGIQSGSFALRLVGKDGSVKLSRNRATPVAEIYALIDTMPMRRMEAASRTHDRPGEQD